MKTTFPKLYGMTKSGRIKEWEIYAAENSDGTAYFSIVYGQEGGKKTTTGKEISIGKNLGKSNETTPYQQACLEAKSRWSDQIDSGYTVSPVLIKQGEDKDRFLPMLAHRYDQHGHKIKWPAACQKKYDGHRCLAKKTNGNVLIWSRKGKLISVPKEIIKELNDIMAEGQSFDGELYKHDWRTESGEPDFQRMTSAIKKYGPDTKHLEYHIYDVPMTDVSFKDRFLDLKLFNTERIKKVETVIVNSEDEAMNFYQECITGENPYEGAIVRNLHGYYQYDYRSYDLLKIKPLYDAEFVIIGGEEASGNDIGTVVFKCQTEDGQEFSVRPIGSREIRKKYWDELDSLLGRKLTVEYNGLTSGGIPRFPRGIRIRDDL